MRLQALLALCLTALPSTTSARDGELHTFHCLHGCPMGAPATNDVVVREIYTLSSNDLTKLADWVAYKITPQTIGTAEERRWAADPALATDETLTPADYNGAPTTLRIDRGHQAPLASFAGTPHAALTNILSNITPQSSALNQGAWVRLENQERALVRQMNKPLYVLTGPLFERMMRPLPNSTRTHRVPSGYWKVLATADGRMSAFIFDQATRRAADLCAHRASLNEVHLRSRLFLFPTTNGAFTSLDSALGCNTPPPPPAAPSEIPPE